MKLFKIDKFEIEFGSFVCKLVIEYWTFHLCNFPFLGVH